MTCVRCGGRVFLDENEHHERSLLCLNCGHRPTDLTPIDKRAVNEPKPDRRAVATWQRPA